MVYSTSIPMLLAVPATIRIAASIVFAFKSGIFNCAISLTCTLVTFPILFFNGLPEAFAIPTARLSRTATGGVFKIKLKLRSEYIEIIAGIIIPSCPCVFALNCLQNSIILIPCCPNAGPTGGAGFACPAGTCSLTCATIFLMLP